MLGRKQLEDIVESKKSGYSLTETAQRIGISRESAYNQAQTGDIPTIRVGRRRIVPGWYFEQFDSAPADPKAGQR